MLHFIKYLCQALYIMSSMYIRHVTLHQFNLSNILRSFKYVYLTRYIPSCMYIKHGTFHQVFIEHDTFH